MSRSQGEYLPESRTGIFRIDRPPASRIEIDLSRKCGIQGRTAIYPHIGSVTSLFGPGLSHGSRREQDCYGQENIFKSHD